jgi:hypothetical protein
MNHLILKHGSMFQKKQTANGLQKAQETYLSILEKGKQLGLHEEAHAEPVRRSENDTHPIVECDTVDATVDQQCQNEV